MGAGRGREGLGHRWGTWAGGLPDSTRDTPRGALSPAALCLDLRQPRGRSLLLWRGSCPPFPRLPTCPSRPTLLATALRFQPLDFRSRINHFALCRVPLGGLVLFAESQSSLLWDTNACFTGLVSGLQEKSYPKRPAESLTYSRPSVYGRCDCSSWEAFSDFICPLSP